MQTLTEIDRTDVAYTILTQTTRPSWGYMVSKVGTPTDYEGIISRDCSFLQCAILLKDPAHALFDEAEKFAPRVPGENATPTPQ